MILRFLRSSQQLVRIIATFNERWYTSQYQDIKNTGVNPLIHFLKYGYKEGRSPNLERAKKLLFTNASIDLVTYLNRISFEERLSFQQETENLKELSRESCDFYFDAKWYIKEYFDVAASQIDPFWHFKTHGFREGRHPNMLSKNLFVMPWGSHVVTFEDFVRVYEKTLRAVEENFRLGEEVFSKNKFQSIAVFFNVARDLIGGGMLSINRFFDLSKQLEHQIGYKVFLSGLPINNAPVEYSHFKSDKMLRFDVITKYSDASNVKLFIPECFACDFFRDLDNQSRSWLIQRSVQVVIMNQNNDLMPDPVEIQKLARLITSDIIISTAHKRYCTESLATMYQMPVKQLTPILPSLTFRDFAKKSKIIMLSPDPVTRGKISREHFIQKLEKDLPDFKLITVENMSLNEYLDLASHAMFSITFGEGLDGYFIEPYIAGGIGFAVYNPIFFPEEFVDLDTIFKSFDEMYLLVTHVISDILSHLEYDAVSSKVRTQLELFYSSSKSIEDLKSLFSKQYDFYPGEYDNLFDWDLNIKDFLGKEHGFSFLEYDRKNKIVRTPDNLLLRHFGGEFYSVLYEIYVKRDYDMNLRVDRQYILVDLGAHVGATSLYLINRYKQISCSYVYEPAEPTFRLLKSNIDANGQSGRIRAKNLGISDEFSIKKIPYFADWSTAFSTDDNTLDAYVNDTTVNSHDPNMIEVEIVPADVEIKEILAVHGNERFLLKCDTQGSEFKVFDNLASSGLLAKFDVVIVETHFQDHQFIVDLLSKAGFSVNARLDSAANNVYTITGLLIDA